MKKLLIIIIALALITPAFTGCKKKPAKRPGPKAQAASPAAQPPAQEKLKPEIEKEDIVYIYDSKGRKSPFESLIKITKKKKEGEKDVAASPFESFNASDFRLLAVAGKVGKFTGLILAPDNKSYTVKEGTVLGLNEGKIRKISLNNIVVEEYIMDYKGELKLNKVVLELRKGEVTE